MPRRATQPTTFPFLPSTFPFLPLPLRGGSLNLVYDKLRCSKSLAKCQQLGMAVVNELIRVRRLVLEIHHKAAPLGTDGGDAGIAALAAAAYEPTWTWCNERKAELLTMLTKSPLTVAEKAELDACFKVVIDAAKNTAPRFETQPQARKTGEPTPRCSCGKQVLGVYEGEAQFEFKPKCKKCLGTGGVAPQPKRKKK